jgi:sphinganine C4-monooxygenase
MLNLTISSDIPPLPSYTLKPLPPIVPGIPDKFTTLIFPIIAYWVVSIFFHWIDVNDYWPQYRLHTPVEVAKRNRVSRYKVVRDVVIQQIIQTIVGVLLGMTEPDDVFGKADFDVAVWALRIRWAQRSIPALLAVFGFDSMALASKYNRSNPSLAGALAGGRYPYQIEIVSLGLDQQGLRRTFARWELLVAKAIYYYLVPMVQAAAAIFIVDTWQYFLHRAMHMNQWLYRTFHSRHHRLYVPYAFGALYNHPFEGFLLDTLGTAVAFKLTFMTTRQGMWFFTCSTIKTVDDHCGYSLPWDPLQHITSNNAGYHDVHHQSWGIKTNFSQPFFTFWDRWMGTIWTGGDVSGRYERAKKAAQKQMDLQTVTGSKASDSLSAKEAPYEDEMKKAQVLTEGFEKASRPLVPAGKATQQAAGSRDQILQDHENGGPSILIDEADEERSEADRQITMKRSSAQNQKLKGLRERVGSGIHGRTAGVLGVQSS